MISRLYTTRLFILLAILVLGTLMVSCNEDEDDNNASNEIVLLSYGPSPILREAEIKFIGRNLDQVSAVVFPDNVEVTDFKVKESGQLVVVVPKAAVPGDIILKTPGGEIVPKTGFDVLEPIVIEDVSPIEIRPGATLTMKGTYLNLIKEVQFALGKTVSQADFLSQSETELKVAVPMDAQSGPVILSNLAENEDELVVMKSEEDITVILPKITEVAPAPVKPGNNLTITGTDLDLTTAVVFQGGATVETFESVSATKLVVVVPGAALEGTVSVRAASSLTSDSPSELSIVEPTISSINPSPVKAGNKITITGTDLDLVTSVMFGGDVDGTIVNQSETQLEVTVPQNASEEVVTLNTVANSVESESALELIDPAITSFSSTSVKSNSELTITGTNLDLVSTVVFGGGLEGTINSQSETELVVLVPVGAESDVITLNTVNSSQVVSTETLTVLPGNVPIITNMPSSVKPGEILAIEGEKMEFVVEVVFPGDIKATRFGTKTSTLLEVYVPEEVEKGDAVITLVTYENETATTPIIMISGTDPIQDESLVFFDFNGTGAKDSWWGEVSIEDDPSHTLDGTSYGYLNGTWQTWTDMFWRNASNNFPGAAVGSDIEGYVLKFDIKLDKPISDGNLKFRLQPGATEYYILIGPAGTSGEVVPATDGWITMTFPLTQFKDNYGWGANGLTDLSGGNATFGVAFDNASAPTELDFYIDNVRFHKID